jgi:YfiH family protein
MDQVHGSSIASVERIRAPGHPLAGCDALVTQTPGLGLSVRTADCLPLFIWDPVQRVVGVAHAGWRGLAAALPLRLISFLHQRYHTYAEEVWIGIGPSIRACCYEVGPAFDPRLTPWTQEQGGRRTCDLIAAATAQLRQAGVKDARILDGRQCTACEPDRWYSLRREGDSCGRLVSCIGLMP